MMEITIASLFQAIFKVKLQKKRADTMIRNRKRGEPAEKPAFFDRIMEFKQSGIMQSMLNS